MFNKRPIILAILAGIVIISASVYLLNQNDNATALPDEVNTTTLNLGQLTFQTSIGDAMHRAQSENKMIFIYGRSLSCGWCKKFEAESFNDERITSLLNENFVLLSIDTVEQRDIAINLGIRATPTSIFTTPNGQEIIGTRIPGYMDQDSFYEHLNEVINNEV
ncbi:MAG: DUF255 domain-containing protein [Methanosarcinales archaeon]|nr:DUF255 domain-containing protein [Methanosarcinaceae archaeon]MDW7777030.1 DUF255 domain-containing protein [Methanosarcinales archaeon]